MGPSEPTWHGAGGESLGDGVHQKGVQPRLQRAGVLHHGHLERQGLQPDQDLQSHILQMKLENIHWE